jgi:hypothetical protein
MGLEGIVLIALSLAVRRGQPIAAWVLVGLSLLEILVRLWTLQPSGLLVPIVAALFFTQGALALKREPVPRVQRAVAWARLTYELAIMQALWTATIVLWSRVAEPLSFYGALGMPFGIRNLLDVGMLLGFGIAAWRRQIWAGVGLVAYQIANAVYVSAYYQLFFEPFLSAGVVALYSVGAYHLYRQYGPLTKWGRAISVVVVITGVVYSGWLLSVRLDPYERTTQEIINRLQAVPGVKEQFQGLDPAVARATGAKLALRGALRLTDDQLMRRAQLMGEILQVLDEHNCAEQLRGGRGTIDPALRKIRPESLRAWYDLAAAAMTAEVQGAPPPSPRPTEEELGTAFLEIIELLPAEEAGRFQQAFDDLQKTKDADACWALRTLVGSIPKVSATSRPALVRLLVLTQ